MSKPPEHIARHLDYLSIAGCTPDSITSRRRALARAEAELGRPLIAAGADDLTVWAAAVAARHEPWTVASYVSHVRSWCRWAVRAGVIASDPSAMLPAVRVPESVPRPMAEDDLAAALAAAPERIRPWLALAGAAGLRCREIACLRREDVMDRADPPVIRVPWRAGKGRKARIVPLSPWLEDQLAPLLARRGRGWLFPRADGKPGPVPAHVVSQRAGAFLHSIGVAGTMHQIRHYYGTTTYRRSGDILMTQRLLGHKKVSTTQGYALPDMDKAFAVVATIRPGAPAPGGEAAA